MSEKPQSMYSTWVEITPQLAEEFLAKNQNNRTLSPRRVKEYATAMATDNWKGIHQGIALGMNGELLDGQHRLHAIIQSQTTISMLVTFNMRPEDRDVIDIGRKRSSADHFHINGVHDPKLASCAARIYWFYQEHPNKVWTNTLTEMSPGYLFDHFCNDGLLDRYEAPRQLANSCYTMWKSGINRPAVCAMCWLLDDAGYYWDEISGFFTSMCSGAVLQHTSPVLAYRNYIINNGKPVRSSGAPVYQRVITDFIKVWNYERQGIPLRQFKPMSYPPMPSIIPSGHQAIRA